MKSLTLPVVFSLVASALLANPAIEPSHSFIQETPVEKKYFSWEDIETDTLSLAKDLEAKGPWNGIIAVARGGLVPAAILAQALNIKMIDTLCLSSYDDKTMTKNENFSVLKTTEVKSGKWLIVDDLVDTGHTAKLAKDLFPEATLVCVYAKPKGEPFTDLYAKKIPQSTWVVFPWEKN